MEKKTIEEMAADVKKEYYREWRAKNKDKVKQHNQNYWTKRAKQLAQTEDKTEDRK